MAANENGFTHQSLQDPDTIVKYLSAIAEGFKKGRLSLASNGQSFSMETPNLVKLDVEAKQKRDRAKLVLRISWKRWKDAATLRVEPLSINGEEEHT